ncbi:MAG: hypothetical protein JSW61_13350 [Candidatus Thorarchaeota archaeon]|nr:MAG: hypothetical protein JSW61_13350 [Candidatus Thorarchaeota archaeon]
MSGDFINYNSDKPHAIGAGLLSAILSVGGYVLSSWMLTENLSNVVFVVGFYLTISLGVFFLGIAIGKHAKTRVEYCQPNWDFQPVQLKLDEAKSLSWRHLRQYPRLTVNGHFMLFYIPVLLILFLIGLPTYASIEIPTAVSFVVPVVTIFLPVLFLSSTLLGFLATSNGASEDFSLPLMRETVWLAKKQLNVPGVTYLRVVLDKAEQGDYTVYKNPRVIVRLDGIEKAAYVESWSEEKGALRQLMCRLFPEDSKDDILWWWLSVDRYFRKFAGNDDEGYYVKNPIQSAVQELGVKDVRLVTMNAVAIILLEWQRIHGENRKLKGILSNLGVPG